MKRQMKIAAVVSATALLAIGASFTSMAAAKTGTWKNEDGVWYCYDKNGDVYENEFCMDGGREFYVGEDGAVVYNSWVEYDGNMYYIQSDGSKAAGVWKELTPYEDEDADIEWYWFNAAGKRVQDKKVAINGETFYFDGDGKVIYGWVDIDNFEQADENDILNEENNALVDIVYTNERGARVTSGWFQAYAPGIDVEEDDLDGISKGWYYAKALGNPRTGKAANIEGESYVFGANGRMLTGWIGFNGTDYVSIDDSTETRSLATLVDAGYDVYFGCTVDGHLKKNKWMKEWNNLIFADADPDLGKSWYWIGKDGKVYVPDADTASASNAVTFSEGVISTTAGTPSDATFKTINNNVYSFNADGKMMSGLFSIDGNIYYFGGAEDGARKIGAQEIKDDMGDAYKFYFGTEDDNGYKMGVAVDGAKNGKLYEDGLLQTADGDYKYKEVTIEAIGKNFIVNKNGSIQTSSKKYIDDGDVVINAEGYTFSTEVGNVKGSIN